MCKKEKNQVVKIVLYICTPDEIYRLQNISKTTFEFV